MVLTKPSKKSYAVYTDECTELENVCPANTRCVNTIGGYECRKGCRPRWKGRKAMTAKPRTTPTTAPTTTREPVLVRKKVCKKCKGNWSSATVALVFWSHAHLCSSFDHFFYSLPAPKESVGVSIGCSRSSACLSVCQSWLRNTLRYPRHDMVLWLKGQRSRSH